ncbi:MAG: SufS family cysteine desulfurase [Fimbriimonadaceae bacterium]
MDGVANVSVAADRLRMDVRNSFPAIHQKVNGHPLVYLDSAATTQKPDAVIDAMAEYYRRDHANVHRGVHTLSRRATDRFDDARAKVARFINAPTADACLFTKGCTEAVNLAAHSWGAANLGPGDVVLLSTLEHHADIVPWQIIAQKQGAEIRAIPIHDDGRLDLDALRQMVSEQVKLIGVVHVSNALGVVNPVEEVVRQARRVDAKVLVDGAQAAAHLPIDVQALDVDFYTLSAHKMYGPTGIGGLYVRPSLLADMPPWQAGGDMIRTVSFEGTTFADPPHRFEPGTPHIAGAIGWAAAVDFIEDLGFDAIRAHERDLIELGQRLLGDIPGVRILGPATGRVAVISFTVDGIHPHDLGTFLDDRGIAIRTGHHCCMPLMKRLGVPATARASLGLYSQPDDLEMLAQSLVEAKEFFGA